MAADLADKVSYLDLLQTVVVVLLQEKSSFDCKRKNGDCLLPCKGRDAMYHAEGELAVICKDLLKEHFMCFQPFSRLSGGLNMIMLIPLPRYLWFWCCDGNMVNSGSLTYVVEMERALRNLTIT